MNQLKAAEEQQRKRQVFDGGRQGGGGFRFVAFLGTQGVKLVSVTALHPLDSKILPFTI